MAKWGKDSLTAADHVGQDGTRSMLSAEEAAMKLFAKPSSKDTLPRAASLIQEQAELDGVEDVESAWTEDPADVTAWGTVSMQAPIPAETISASHAETAPEPTIRDIIVAITSCNTAITALTPEIKGVKLEVNLVRHDMQKLHDRTAALEGRMSNVEDEVVPLQRELHHVQSYTAGNTVCIEDIENRLRRNNVRAMGIPEKAEGKNLVAFIENWLTNTFGEDSFSKMFTVERANRVPAKLPRPGEPPRPFLFKLLNFKDRDAILHQARTRSNLMKIDVRIPFYPDFSAEVQHRRAKFLDVKKRLRKYVASAETHFFENPVAAFALLDRVEHTLQRANTSAVET